MSISGPSEFPQALYDGCEGLIELRALKHRGGVSARTFVAPGEDPEALRGFLRDHQHDNLYFGVATRTDASGDLAHCLHLSALFVDVDFKTTPVEQARDAVRRFPLKPSAVVRSGGGVHLYFFLRESMDLREEAARAKNLLRRLTAHLGGDISAAEPARILRVPGTQNYKYTPARPVTLTHLNAEARYNPLDFDSLLPSEPQRERREPRFAMPGLVGLGARNSTLYQLGRSLKARGLSEPEILATLLAANVRRCQPPLGDDEVCAIAHQAATQRDQSNFTGYPRRRFIVETL